MCIGFTEDGKAVGVESPQLLVQTIRNDLLERCNFTEALITARRVWMKSVVDVVLPSHPYTVLCDGEVFITKDSHTIVAQGEERNSLMANLYTGPMDAYPVFSASFEDLDQDLIEDFVITADPDEDFHDTRGALMKLLDWDGKAVTRALVGVRMGVRSYSTVLLPTTCSRSSRTFPTHSPSSGPMNSGRRTSSATNTTRTAMTSW